jgi:hypothetical protein
MADADGQELRWIQAKQHLVDQPLLPAAPPNRNGQLVRLPKAGRCPKRAGQASSASAVPSSTERPPIPLLLFAVAARPAHDVQGQECETHLLLGMGGTAECLGSKDIWVSRVAWKDLTPGALFGPSAAGCGCASSLTSRPLARGGVPRRWASVQAAVEDWWLTARRRSGREGRGCRSGLGGCWIRAQAPAGPGRIGWNQVTGVSAVVSPSGARWTHRMSEWSRPPA